MAGFRQAYMSISSGKRPLSCTQNCTLSIRINNRNYESRYDKKNLAAFCDALAIKSHFSLRLFGEMFRNVAFALCNYRKFVCWVINHEREVFECSFDGEKWRFSGRLSDGNEHDTLVRYTFFMSEFKLCKDGLRVTKLNWNSLNADCESHLLFSTVKTQKVRLCENYQSTVFGFQLDFNSSFVTCIVACRLQFSDYWVSMFISLLIAVCHSFLPLFIFFVTQSKITF